MKIKNIVRLRLILLLCAVLAISVYFLYRPDAWPLGFEALGCVGAFLSIVITLTLLWVFRERLNVEWQERSILYGLWIGLLWALEIGINNFIKPKLPLRDYIDNSFWAVIAFLILIISFRQANRSKRIYDGIISGFWAGLASGAIACLTALLLIVFGLRFVLNDPLSLKEWADISIRGVTESMPVYFAYQSFTGAIMHLYILGALMGFILGMTGGLVGRIFQKI